MAKKPKNTKKKTTRPKNKGGRPTKYKSAYCNKLIEHFDIEPWEEREIPHYKDGELAWTDIKRLPARMPTLRGFAKTISVGISTIYDWLNKEHTSFQGKFSDAFICAREIRKDWLIDVGLSGGAPPASFKFVAVNVTDMRDKIETKHDVTPELQTVLGLINGSTKGKLPSEDSKDSSGTS